MSSDLTDGVPGIKYTLPIFCSWKFISFVVLEFGHRCYSAAPVVEKLTAKRVSMAESLVPVFVFMQAEEIWMPIVFPVDLSNKYQISNKGRVKKLGRYAKIKKHWIPDQIIKCFPNSKGYIKAKLKGERQVKQYAVHRLVALHFIPNPDGLPEVNHLDFDKTNNDISNLEWTTGQGNMDHYYANGNVVRGTSHYRLTKEDVVYIRQNILIKGIDELANKFNMHPGYIYAVGTGRKRKDVYFEPYYKNIGVTKIILDIKTGVFYESADELAALLGTRRKYIHRWLNGERGPNPTSYRYV